MPKYKKRADGRYQKNVKIGTTADGKPKYKSIFGKTGAELEANVSEFIVLKNKGIVVTDSKMPFDAWADKWFLAYKQTLTVDTVRMYAAAVKTLKTAPFAKMPLSKISVEDIQIYLSAKRLNGITRSVDILKLTLKQIFEKAIDNNLIYKNPVGKVEIPVHKAPPKRAINDFERKAIAEADLMPRERLYLYLCLYAGLRREEALALTVSDIDYQKREISVTKVNKNGIIEHRAKSDAGYRTVPLPSKLQQALKAYVPDGLFYLSMRSGEPMTKSSFSKFWKHMKNKLNAIAPIDFTSHILRHTYATSLFEAGIDVKTAQKILGHASIVVTMDIYNHLSKSTAEITEKLESVMR